MEDRRFDSFVKSVAHRSNRRRLLTGVLGLGAGVVVAAVANDSTEAARRGFAGPFAAPPTPVCLAVGESCSDSSACCSNCCVSAGGAPFFCEAEGFCE